MITVIKPSSDSHQAFIRQSWILCQSVIKPLSISHQAFIIESSSLHQTVKKPSSDSHQAFIRQSSSLHQTVMNPLSVSHESFFRQSWILCQSVIMPLSVIHQAFISLHDFNMTTSRLHFAGIMTGQACWFMDDNDPHIFDFGYYKPKFGHFLPPCGPIGGAHMVIWGW